MTTNGTSKWAAFFGSPVLVAFLTVTAPILIGQCVAARKLQETTVQAAEKVVAHDSVQTVRADARDERRDTVQSQIHVAVNSAKTKLEGQNQGLIILLKRNKIPVPPGLQSVEQPPPGVLPPK